MVRSRNVDPAFHRHYYLIFNHRSLHEAANQIKFSPWFSSRISFPFLQQFEMDKEILDALDDDLGDEIKRASPEEIMNRTKLLENDIKIMKSDTLRLTHEQSAIKAKIKENQDKVKLSKQLPFLVSNVVELLPVDPEEVEEGAAVDLDSQRKGTSAVIKTSTRQVFYLLIRRYFFRCQGWLIPRN